jgi:hypothetical protein
MEPDMKAMLKDALKELMAGGENLPNMPGIMQVNAKRVLAHELNMDADHLQNTRFLDKVFAVNMARLMNVAAGAGEDVLQEMTTRSKDVGIARERHEKDSEERMEELEEQMARTTNTATEQTSGVNAQMTSINQIIADAASGVVQQLIASGVLKVASENVKTP